MQMIGIKESAILRAKLNFVRRLSCVVLRPTVKVNKNGSLLLDSRYTHMQRGKKNEIPKVHGKRNCCLIKINNLDSSCEWRFGFCTDGFHARCNKWTWKH